MFPSLHSSSHSNKICQFQDNVFENLPSNQSKTKHKETNIFEKFAQNFLTQKSLQMGSITFLASTLSD